jgi:hypothetical protein
VSDCPVKAFDANEANNRAAVATSSRVVNSPPTVFYGVIFLITAASEIPSFWACSGIYLSTSGAIAPVAPVDL